VYRPAEGKDAADRSVSCLVGRQLTAADPSAAPGSWVFQFGADCRLTIGGTWRLIKGGMVMVAGGDHQQLFGLTEPVDASRRVLEGIAYAVIKKASFDDVSGDLTIEFSKDLRLQILTDSSGYESWTLWRPDGTQLVADGGGRVLPYARTADR